MSYSNLYNGSYSLSKDNMKLHLMQENEQKLIEIDNIHLEKKIIQIKKNRNNNEQIENIQKLSNERNMNNNSHKENMKRLANEREEMKVKEILRKS